MNISLRLLKTVFAVAEGSSSSTRMYEICYVYPGQTML